MLKLGKFFTKIRHITKLAQNGQIFTKIRHISKLAQNGQMLYENSWAIRLIAALLLNFMSHIRPVPSPQGGFGGLSPLNSNTETINEWSFFLSARFIISSIKCFDLSLLVHTQQFLNENHELSRSHSRQIDLRRQCLHFLTYSRAGFGQKLLA